MIDYIILGAVVAALALLSYRLFRLTLRKEPDRTVNPAPASAAGIPAVAGSVVRIRHASDSIVVEILPHDQVLGPLSDASMDVNLWDSLRSGNLTKEQKRTVADKLREQGFSVTIEDDAVESVETAAAPEQDAESAPALEEDGPAMVREPLSTWGLGDLQELIVKGLREHMCTPAFARLAYQMNGFSITFEDPVLENRSNDRTEMAVAEQYREEMRRDLAAAMRLYSEDHPEEREDAPGRSPSRRSVALPDYDYSRLR